LLLVDYNAHQMRLVSSFFACITCDLALSTVATNVWHISGFNYEELDATRNSNHGSP